MLKHVARTCLVVGIALGGLWLSSGSGTATAATDRVCVLESAGTTPAIDDDPSAMSCNAQDCQASCLDKGFCGSRCSFGVCQCMPAICE
jgi:hypothetical protein